MLSPIYGWGFFTAEETGMDGSIAPGMFYFLSDQYFIDFPDQRLMQNKESINGRPHGRPCFYAFTDEKTGLLWMIPVSSQVAKYHIHADKKIAKYGRCETILFGEVLGHEKAFLIQNMCPVTDDYIAHLYMDVRSSTAVNVDGGFAEELVMTAKRVLGKVRQGLTKLVFPDVLSIERKLLQRIAS